MDTKTSPFQIILLVAFGALFAAGVVIFALTNAVQTGTTIGAVSIWGTLDAATFNEVVHAASDDDPRLAGVTYVQKDPVTFHADLVNALSAGKGPDLVLIPQDWSYRDKGKLTPYKTTDISPSQFDDLFVEAAAPFSSADSVIALPVLVDPLVLFWNKDVLAAGGHAVAPTFWDDVVQDVRDITKTSDSGEIVRAGVNLGTYKNIGYAKDIVSTLIMQAGNPITQIQKNGELGSVLAAQRGDAMASTTNALTFYTEFADPSLRVYTWNDSLPEARTMFANGDLGLYIGHASDALLIAKQNPNLNFAMSGFPQIKGQKYMITGATVYGLAVSNVSKNRAGAQTTASILSSRTLSSALAARFSMTSALRTVVSSSTTDGTQDLFNRQAVLAKTWVDPDPEQTDTLFQGMIEDIISGAVKPQESAQRIDKSMSALLTTQQEE